MRMLLLLSVFVPLAYSQGFQVGDFWIYNNFNDKECSYAIQVNEGGKVLLSTKGRVAGSYQVRRCFDSADVGCFVENGWEDDFIKLGRVSFENSKGEVCFLEDIRGSVWGTGCFSWGATVIRDVLFKVSCEVPNENPDCGSEKYAKQVIMENHRAACDSLGGNFEGAVYPHELPDGNTMYCFSGSCDACDSKWRDDTMNDWKDEVCCGERGQEPNKNNGVCQRPRPPNPSSIGGNYSKITAFPGCSNTPAGMGENSWCEPPSSSSVAPPESSSSFEDWSSSSEDTEDADCYISDAEANAALKAAEWQCKLSEGNPNFFLDKRKCISGECGSSSSEEQESSSSEGGDDACVVTKSFLKKEANLYDDWVYLGKEKYGSRHVRRNAVKPGTTFFDVLGRAYREMKAKIQYYVFDKDINRNEFDVPLELEVFGKIVKDIDGKDIQVFIKEDKARGVRRDSSFYWDGSWEVFEEDFTSKEISLRKSSGSISRRKYDDNNRLTENYLIDKNGDTIISEQYEWQNGRLVRMIENGITRKYIYGKTLQDTIKVIPSDEGIRFHSGYNNTIGKMPIENNPEYKYFVLDPYKYSSSNNETNNNYLSNYTPKNFMLAKISGEVVNSSCVNKYSGMPTLECIRLTKNHLKNANKKLSQPNENNKLIYGHSDAELSKKRDCKCIDGKYNIEYDDKPINEYIQVVLSAWDYDNTKNDWVERCWNKSDMQNTYYHEVLHIENMRKVASVLFYSHFMETTFDTEIECKKKADEQFLQVEKLWKLLYQAEQQHEGEVWEKEKKIRPFGQYRAGERCVE